MIITGSTALYRFGIIDTIPNDIDVWYSENEFNIKKKVETKIEYDNIICKNPNVIDKHIIPQHLLELIPTVNLYATPDAIYTIKCSHFAWDYHWEKTKRDILYLKNKGCKLIPDLYKALYEYWITVHGNKDFLSLDKLKEDFFTDGVKYIYDHDYLHELVAYPNKPVYTKCLKDTKEVLLDKNKFDILSFEDKIRMFSEEITVIACERWLLNPIQKDKYSWYETYNMSLKKTIINLTKNWATEFIIFNLEHFVKPDYQYFKNLITTLKGKEMENVDLTVFYELQRELGIAVDKDIQVDLIMGLAHDTDYILDIDDISDVHDYKEIWSFVKPVLEKFEYKHLEQEGGGEGGAEDCHGVFELKGKIYKAWYSYYSYNGYEYDNILDTLKEVKPVKRLVTFYE